MMNVLKRLFSKKNKNSEPKHNEINPKPKLKKYSTNTDLNKINTQISNEIYIEHINIVPTLTEPLNKNDKLLLDTNISDIYSCSNNTHHQIIDMDGISSTGTDSSICIKESTNTPNSTNTTNLIKDVSYEITNVSFNNGTSGGNTITHYHGTGSTNNGKAKLISGDETTSISGANTTSDEHTSISTTKGSIVNSENHNFAGLTSATCNISSVTGVEEILNQIIRELNNIIIQREKLKRKLKLKENSYKLVTRKFNTMLNNKAYRPIKLM